MPLLGFGRVGVAPGPTASGGAGDAAFCFVDEVADDGGFWRLEFGVLADGGNGLEAVQSGVVEALVDFEDGPECVGSHAGPA